MLHRTKWFALHLAQSAAISLVLVGLAAVLAPAPARAVTHDRVDQLEAEVAILKQQVAELRALMPTFTNFMPDFSERFHVMHRAGEAGDWAVAQHELLEMKRMLGLAKVIDAEKGRLMESFLAEHLDQISAAIEHQNEGRFLESLESTVQNCNACHQAAGSPFINVALNGDRALSMRHAHEFVNSKPMSKHTHKH